jgi:hypothetical protein
MNAPMDCPNVQVSDLSDSLQQPVGDVRRDAATAGLTIAPTSRETAPAADEKICWIEVRESPYPPDQQVELLHLQAEAEALLLQLQTLQHRRQG